MVENKTNVNEYILHLLSNKQFCVSEYSKYIENGYYIENIDGIVTAELLSKLIRQAKRNKKNLFIFNFLSTSCSNFFF